MLDYGSVIFYNPNKKFGMIDSNRGPLFFSAKDLRNAIIEGDKVTFNVKESEIGKLSAYNIVKVENQKGE